MSASSSFESLAEQPDSASGAGRLGRYPTPVERLDALSTDAAELWIKNDGLVSELYGGNKVRKLELLLARAEARGARRIVTAGAAGSHQLLATALFGRERGFEVAAALCPQPRSAHAEHTLAAAIALGATVERAASMASVPLVVARMLRRGDFFVAPGGAGLTGTVGYLRAVAELVEQLRRDELPEPDLIVAPLGSGGTVAGLLAGVVREGLRAQVVGVDVVGPAALGRARVIAQAWGVLRGANDPSGPIRLGSRLSVDDSWLGRGYGWATPEADEAARTAEILGLSLDPTYTAKAFAACLSLVGGRGFSWHPGRALPAAIRAVRAGKPLRVLYWHTLSATKLANLPGLGVGWERLPRELDQLFI
jgi:D-cysteine desulfhydrase